MTDKPYENNINKEFSYLLAIGFQYEYIYEKGGDSSCCYIYRFKKGNDFIDFRITSGDKKGRVVVFSNGEYKFPNLIKHHFKDILNFRFKHPFSRKSPDLCWEFAGYLLRKEIKDCRLFGIRLY